MKEIKPLEGIRILDFTRLLSGPLGTHIISEMGAGAINLEVYSKLYKPFYK